MTSPAHTVHTLRAPSRRNCEEMGAHRASMNSPECCSSSPSVSRLACTLASRSFSDTFIQGRVRPRMVCSKRLYHHCTRYRVSRFSTSTRHARSAATAALRMSSLGSRRPFQMRSTNWRTCTLNTAGHDSAQAGVRQEDRMCTSSEEGAERLRGKAGARPGRRSNRRAHGA